MMLMMLMMILSIFLDYYYGEFNRVRNEWWSFNVNDMMMVMVNNILVIILEEKWFLFTVVETKKIKIEKNRIDNSSFWPIKDQSSLNFFFFWLRISNLFIASRVMMVVFKFLIKTNTFFQSLELIFPLLNQFYCKNLQY